MIQEGLIHEICENIDRFTADLLAESIIENKSYDKLEAKYGVLPVSRRSFYRMRGHAIRLAQKYDESIL